MRGAVIVAAVASICSLLQGWDNAAIAGAILFIKRDYELEKNPKIEGLIVAMSFIGATIVTTFSGAISDWIGRRPLLILSSVFYFISGLLMFWAPNIYVLLVARLVDGFGVGLAVMLVPVYISEIAPSDVRGFLNTLPQFSGCGGIFLSYSMIFTMSLIAKPDWRLILGALAIPSVISLVLTIFYLPESPRWLVSKGRMMEAKLVLQRLRGKEDVSGEMALLVEGLSANGEASIEEYVLGPANELTDDHEPTDQNERVIVFGLEDGQCWVARLVAGQSVIGSALVHVYCNGSIDNQICPIKDHVVALFGCVHRNLPEIGSLRSTMFPNFGSMFTMSEQNLRTEQFYEEIGQMEGEGYASDTVHSNTEENLQTPLLSRQTTGTEGDEIVPLCVNNDTLIDIPRNMQGCEVIVGGMGIGGGWQLAWNWLEREGADGKMEVEFKRIYLRQEGFPESGNASGTMLAGADLPEQPKYINASALVSVPALCPKELMDQDPSGPVMFHPLKNAAKGPRWSYIFEAGVRHALFLGIGIQLLQQFAGITGVLYYAPQILKQAGAEVLLENMGINSDSSAFLLSALATLLMLPCIAVTMRLVDIIGRRSMLLATIPALIVSSLILTVVNLVPMKIMFHAALSTIGIVIYICCFFLGFGPIPSILCSEMFPTCIRGVCISVCFLAFCLGAITVTFSVPMLLGSIGFAGLFGINAVACIIALLFVYLKIPETKGIPLEIITELFAVATKKIERNQYL
ncbi:hypothetical protein J5N97_021739 [Dioscorea zingiberensis]|uniref:Major facilitator superfamily (MFS) profile domain-containing protein n=1 Tax=Dioscorea zingiberensis TaxID=325984 RepID=A0A9D5CA49_9LILI|nr:hypothetical protein J5N97_021739 [Dioscorea zingiberensis]